MPALPATAGNQTSKFYRLVRVSAYTHKHTHTHNTHITHITHTHTVCMLVCLNKHIHTYIHACMHTYVAYIHRYSCVRTYVMTYIQHNNGYNTTMDTYIHTSICIQNT